LLATIKVHSSLQKYFNQQELRADFNTYNDIFHYLHAMHPRFNHYMNMISWGHANESFALLDKNYNLVIWPDHIQSKDVNDMVMSGMKIDEVNNLISTNTFAGLEALTKLTNYKKC